MNIHDLSGGRVRFFASTLESYGSAYLITTGPRNLDDLMRGLSTLLPGPFRLLSLDQELPAYRGVLILKEALEAGQTVILGCTSVTHLGMRLFYDLSLFRKLSSGETMFFAHHVALGPRPDGPVLGKAVVLHQLKQEAPGNCQLDNIRREINYIPLWGDDAALLEDRGRSLSGEPVFTIGMKLTMRDLCLLHERDPLEGEPKARPHRSTVQEICSDPTKTLSWTELRVLIMNPLDLELPVALFNQKQLTEEQFYCYLDAKELLKQVDDSQVEAPSGRKIYASVYDATWAVMSSPILHQFFRGQLNSEWILQCSLFRSSNSEEAPDNRTLIWRLQQTSAFLQELRSNQQRYLGGTVDDDSLLVIAQHFGLPTHLLDFTRSVGVAAFFATKSQEKNESPIGAIYCLNTNDDVVFVVGGANQGGSAETKAGVGANERLCLGRLGEPLGIDIEDLAGIHFGDLRVLIPKLPQQEDRIGRQKGVFIEHCDPRHLKEARITVYYFRQQPGVTYEDPRAGIDKKTLLPDDTGLTQLARTIEDRFQSPDSITLDPTLVSVVMSRPTIIGSMGSLLELQVHFGRQLLEKLGGRLRELGGQQSVAEIQKILLDYFEACRIHARLGEEAPGWKNEKPFGGMFLSAALGQATLRLARWADVNETVFANTLANEVEGLRVLFYGGHQPLKPVLEPKNLRERIALTCGYYLSGWEHLRYVGGFEARDLTWKAEGLLKLGQKESGGLSEV